MLLSTGSLTVLLSFVCLPSLCTAQPQPVPPTAATCSAHVSFAGSPNATPTYLVWKQVLQSFDTGDQLIDRGSLSAHAIETISMRAAAVRQRLAELGKSPHNASQSEEAETVLSARDDLIRATDRGTFVVLERAASIVASSIEIDTPAIGTVRTNRTGDRECVVRIRGSQYPQFVPDEAYWYLYFASRYNAAKNSLDALGHVSQQYVQSVRDLQIPSKYIEQLLNTIAETMRAFAAFPNSAAGEIQRTQLIMDARAELIRTMPEIVWLPISNDAIHARNGISFSYSSSIK